MSGKCLLVCGCLLSFLLLAADPLRAEDWPCWRGPRGDGSSAENNVPTRWSDTENIAWKVALPYSGHSSPVVWGDRVFVLGTDLDQARRMVAAHDRKTGKHLWEKAIVAAPLERKHRLNSFASSTPAVDRDRLYVSFLEEKQMLIVAYDHSGNELWRVHPGVFSSVHGYCSSPVLYKDKVIVNGDHDGEAYLVALDRATGRTLWKTPRENKTRSYCTPIIREIAGRTQMMLSGSLCVASYNPDDGKLLWIVDGPTEQFVASPVFSHDLLFITGGFPEHHVLTIDPRGSGNVTETNIVWRHQGKLASYVPSPIAVGDYFIVVSDAGLGTCLAAATGKILWSEQLSRHYSASVVTAGGLVYLLDDDGVTKVIKPGPTLEIVATNELKDHCYASPAISRGQLFVRSDTSLFCIGKNGNSTASR
jgi:outer membrane protein assembly factor BamB